jgi:4-amino-4-deoxy-L-arabinose transferase-like glycosyltransferase
MRFLLDWLAGLPVRSLVRFILLLGLPAFLIHLGAVTFIDDESIRAQVALEMHLSGNYIATTLHGEPYINKPPLFNWMLLAAFRAWNAFTELPARLVTVLSLAGYALLIFVSVRRRFSFETAFVTALMVVTCGRFLFYDAMLGLIDTTFSVVTYGLFMSLYFLGVRGRWRLLFLSSYGLMAIGFMLKGFPAIVFQGLSLPAALLFFRQPRRLISIDHLLGLLVAAAVLGGYLFAYAWYESPDRLLANLMHRGGIRLVAHGAAPFHFSFRMDLPFSAVFPAGYFLAGPPLVAAPAGKPLRLF